MITSKDRSSRWKISKKSLTLHDTLQQINLKDINRSFHPKWKEHILLKCKLHKEYSLGLIFIEINLNKLKSIEIVLSIFSDYNGMKLEIRQIKMEVSVGTTNWITKVVLRKKTKAGGPSFLISNY